MKKIHILLIQILILFSACHNKNKSPDEFVNNRFNENEEIIKKANNVQEVTPINKSLITISVPTDLDRSGIKISELLDSVYYVRLETKSNSLIGEIDELLFCDTTIIVVEKVKRQSVLLFSNKGKFLRKIGKNGKGAGEYLSIIDVCS